MAAIDSMSLIGEERMQIDLEGPGIEAERLKLLDEIAIWIGHRCDNIAQRCAGRSHSRAVPKVQKLRVQLGVGTGRRKKIKGHDRNIANNRSVFICS